MVARASGGTARERGHEFDARCVEALERVLGRERADALELAV
jgi:hypothetical protein